MAFMRQNKLLPNSLRRMWTLPPLASLAILSTSFGRAQDASCKVVADAETLLLRTPHHLYTTEVRQGRSFASVVIDTPGGVYVGTNGVWHKATGSIQDFAQIAADSLKQLRDCRHVADEVSDAQPAAKYTLHNAASGGDESVWIAKGSGLPLISEALIEGRRISSRYDYSNIQPPPNVR